LHSAIFIRSEAGVSYPNKASRSASNSTESSVEQAVKSPPDETAVLLRIRLHFLVGENRLQTLKQLCRCYKCARIYHKHKHASRVALRNVEPAGDAYAHLLAQSRQMAPLNIAREPAKMLYPLLLRM